MITVIHMSGNKEPDIYFGIDQKTEDRILKDLRESNYKVTRSTDEEWYGQSNPKYSVHHWNAIKKGG